MDNLLFENGQKKKKIPHTFMLGVSGDWRRGCSGDLVFKKTKQNGQGQLGLFASVALTAHRKGLRDIWKPACKSLPFPFIPSLCLSPKLYKKGFLTR